MNQRAYNELKHALARERLKMRGRSDETRGTVTNEGQEIFIEMATALSIRQTPPTLAELKPLIHYYKLQPGHQLGGPLRRFFNRHRMRDDGIKYMIRCGERSADWGPKEALLSRLFLRLDVSLRRLLVDFFNNEAS